MSKQSFITIIEDDLDDAEQAVVNGAKASLNYLDQVYVTDIKPGLQDAYAKTIALIENNGGPLLMQLAQDAVALLVGTPWSVVTAKIVTDATAAGVTFVKGEEAIAASTALQIQQNLKAQSDLAAAPQVQVDPPAQDPNAAQTGTTASAAAQDVGVNPVDASAANPAPKPPAEDEAG